MKIKTYIQITTVIEIEEDIDRHALGLQINTIRKAKRAARVVSSAIPYRNTTGIGEAPVVVIDVSRKERIASYPKELIKGSINIK